MLEIIWNQIRNPRIELEKVTTDFLKFPLELILVIFTFISLPEYPFSAYMYVFSYKNLN